MPVTDAPHGPTTGLDVGGAHLKLAQVDGTGRVVAALQVPCRLWQGLEQLDAALDKALARVAVAGRYTVTMTGELADIFPDRATGVRRLVEHLGTRLGPALYWAGREGMVGHEAAIEQAPAVASANWLATATLVARRVEAALFLDIGSTTTDLVPVAGGRVLARGHDDHERLATGELVYTGATRTMLAALAHEVPFGGRRVAVMNEHFATTADVWRVLGLLPEHTDQHPAADGGPKTAAGSARRLARMVGADVDSAPPAAWRRLAAVFARTQVDLIARAIELQLSRGVLDETAPVVVAGAGGFIAARIGMTVVPFAALVDALPQAAGGVDACAPAVAVALLAASPTA